MRTVTRAPTPKRFFPAPSSRMSSQFAAALTAVHQQHGRLIQRGGGDVDAPIVVEVGEGRTSIGPGRRQASLSADVQQLRSAGVEIQLVRLPVGGVHVDAIHLRVDMSVGDEDILQPVVVEVEESDAPAQIAPAIADESRMMGIIDECTLAGIAIERVVVVGEVGDHDVEPAVVVEIFELDAHAGLLAAILTEGDAGLDRDVGERAVTVVAIQIDSACCHLRRTDPDRHRCRSRPMQRPVRSSLRRQLHPLSQTHR